MLGITTYTIVPDVIVVYGCSCGGSCGGSVYPASSVVISGLLHPVTTVEQVVAGTQVDVSSHVVVVVHVVSTTYVVIGKVEQVDVSSHVVIGSHVVVGSHTVVVHTGGRDSHMEQDVVVITSVVVVQLVGQRTTEVMVSVTVPTT